MSDCKCEHCSCKPFNRDQLPAMLVEMREAIDHAYWLVVHQKRIGDQLFWLDEAIKLLDRIEAQK
jgi:hypothetical protein